ncbi:Rtt106-domain-containing protein [Aureobasidium sp. EXF-3400]|nr:Rtt106-domain-containing protein [Aureobasidium sp. EXF-12344]KAI4770332.1 Rtt106-domain-containing protein [Aureobasidium sp. EXF-3400]
MDAIQTAFGHDTALCDRILAAAKENRDQMQLFVDIAKYMSQHMSGKRTSEDDANQGPDAKKRKMQANAPAAASPSQALNSTAILNQKDLANVLYSVPETSFAVPQRKKMTVQLAADPQRLEEGAIRVVHEASGVNLAVPFSKIEQVFCLPVPEKATRQWNFVVFANQTLDLKSGDRVIEAEQIVWTMTETAPANVKAADGFAPLDVDTYVTSAMRSLNACIKGHGKNVIIPTEQEFSSAIPQSHRKGEAAYHVKAHKGSKDGYLFFLSVGIVWAFKKPLALFTFENIESISYTSVLQRTFNIVITTMPDPTTGEKQDIEFSMLDQADFAGIDEYVKRHDLNDASMAADRRAKKLNINPKPKTEVTDAETAGAAGAGDEDDEMTELQKAEQALQDQEDEEEEDYDPGSDAESEGSGSDSEDEEGVGGGEEEEEEELEYLEDEEE